jgi:ABC-2 type transport system permease protein
MNRLFQHKYWWVLLLLLVVGVNFSASKLHKRIDLTAEKRYSLSKAGKNLLRNLKEDVTVEVFLKGQFPAGFKRLANSTSEFLDECREVAGGKLRIKFTDPLKGMNDSAAARFTDSLTYFYDLAPRILGDPQMKPGEESKQKAVIPGAIVSNGDRTAAVNLLRGTQATGTKEEELADLYNKVEASLEYKFMDAIQKVTAAYRPKIGYAVGHGEPGPPVANDAISTLLGRPLFPPPPPEAANDTLNSRYLFNSVNIRSIPFIPEQLDALIITKPTQPFSEYDKLKIDQYVMRGGKVFWMIDNMYAEFDSLMRSEQQSFIAFDRGLNIDDLLFRYGVRLNQNLLQDLQSDVIPLNFGSDGSGQQAQLFKFPFFPILNGTNHSITKNLDGIRAIFPNTLDTIAEPGIRKTILLTSSANARIIGAPYKVDFEFMRYAEDPKMFQAKDTAVAVLLEGNFTSFFKNRLSTVLADSLKAYDRSFISQSEKEGKMIVVADGDVALNQVSQLKGPLAMGQNLYTENSFANKDFFVNCIEYLTNNSGILEARGKDFTLRLLDPVKKEQQQGKWKFIAVGMPVLLVLLSGFIFGWVRKRKYAL